MTARRPTKKGLASSSGVRCEASRPQALTTEQVAKEGFTWSAPEAFKKDALIKDYHTYKEIYDESISDPGAFWGKIAKTFHW